jgi:osmoprotectant transport system ATP-binding protein
MSEYAIEFQQVYKKFTGAYRYSVEDVSLKIENGSFTTIVGSSGSGKTTLLKMINRIYDPTAGQIFFDGQNVNELKVENYRKKIGYVIQQIGLFPHMTIAQNIATVPKSLKWDKKRIKERVDYLLEMVHLQPAQYRDRYPAQLSGGQQQRVGIARAMAAEPSVMLMDEPFGALDTITRKILQDEIQDIQKRLGKTILFVTHDIHEAFKLGRKVIIMDNGRVQQHDTPFNILFHPANEYVANLVSHENLLEKLQVLQAASIMKPLNGASANGASVRSDEPLSTVLCKFMEGGLSSVLVTDGSGKAIGRISWEEFNRISLLNDGVIEFHV